MIGSSAGVMAVLIFTCVYNPNYEIKILFFNIKLLYIGLFFVLFDIIQIPYGNAGGHFAHLGGSFVGFFMLKKLKLDQIYLSHFHHSFLIYLKSLKRKENKIINIEFNGLSKKDLKQKKIDEILDKISSSGYDSLSQKEKDFLFKNGEK